MLTYSSVLVELKNPNAKWKQCPCVSVELENMKRSLKAMSLNKLYIRLKYI